MAKKSVAPKARKLSHPFEVMREVYALQNAEHRFRGIAAGLIMCDRLGATPGATSCREVLRDAIVAEAGDLYHIAERLNKLVGRDIPARRRAAEGGA
jgi:hypothetical protein